MKYKTDLMELYRRIKRILDGGNWSYRRIFIMLIIFTVTLLYFGPSIVRWLLLASSDSPKDPLSRCMDERLTPFYGPSLGFDASIRHTPPFPHEKDIAPLVGNGYFGLEISRDSNMFIKGRRALSVPVYFHPIVTVTSSMVTDSKESTVVEYLNGIVNRFQCFDQFFVSYQYYAHRNMPNVFVQEIKVTNTRNQLIDVDLVVPRISDWPSAISQVIKLKHGGVTNVEYHVTTGIVEREAGNDEVVVIVYLVYRYLQRTMTLKKRGTTNLELLTTVSYSEPVTRAVYETGILKAKIEKSAIEAMEKALQEAVHDKDDYYDFRRQHIKAWNGLWATGFQISTSKAENSLNGDRINSTIYAVLSHVRAYEFEESITPQKKESIARALTYAEGCYDGHHTLEAENLWREMSTMEIVNDVVTSWLLTLEKKGCHNLIRAGASGMVQAMVLSFGSFRFSNQHLELRIHPKYLHRDYHFRRLNYGNMTHVNLTIEVTEDNKAVMYLALDRSDGSYYACDAGCLHEPVALSQIRRIFPVKLTDPFTAILYITSDKEHIEELHHAIHVKEVMEAPAHENHVLALHRHGHKLGSLPALFWVSVCAIIIIFHIFLCKLIAKEYLDPPDKMRYRYSKP